MPPTSQKQFRFQSKYVFLTYPKCTTTAETLLPYLWDKLTPYLIFFIAIATELHQDGTPHLHCLIQLNKKPHIRDPHFFDHEENHPNIQPARDSKHVLDYISKDGQIITRGEFKHHKVSPKKIDDRWRDIMDTAQTKEEYLDLIRSNFPHEWATKLHWLEYSAEKLFPTIQQPYQSPFNEVHFHCHEQIQEWLNTDLYTVSLDSYKLIHNEPHHEAIANLEWMQSYTRNPLSPEAQSPEGEASTSAAQQEQERQVGPDHSDSTTFGVVPSTSQPTTSTQPTTSSTTSPSNSVHHGNN